MLPKVNLILVKKKNKRGKYSKKLAFGKQIYDVLKNKYGENSIVNIMKLNMKIKIKLCR